MAQTDGSLGSLLQGVSQQSRRDRLDGQCTEQINMLADVASDLVRRPHTEHIANLLTSTANFAYHLHDIEDEQYIVLMAYNVIRVFRVSDGLEQTVLAPGGYGYLSTATVDIRKQLHATTIGDYTIIANRLKQTAMTAAVTSNVTGAVIDVIIPGITSQTYSVFIGGVLAASYTTPSSGTTGFGCEDIAGFLHTNLAASAFAATYDFAVGGASIYVTHKSGTVDFDITASSDAGEDAIKVINNDVRDLSDLPKYHVANKIVKVSGKDNSVDNDYYVIFTGDVNVEGTWEETLAPGLQYRVDTATMPHALVRTTAAATDKFYFGPVDGSTQDGIVIEDWVDRLTGDDNSNPLPRFIEQSLGIEYVSQWQNRLVMLSGPNVVLSKTNSFFNIFNKSALTILDDDPILLVNPSTEYTVLRKCVNHNRHLVVFSDTAQLVIKGTSKVTPITAALTLSSAYESDLTVADPLALGASVLFPFKQGNYVGVRDYITGQTADQNLADSVTEHVKKYIKGNVLKVVGSANHNTVLIQADDDLATLYCYQFLWQNNERIQSAWSKWVFKYDIRDMFIVDQRLYFITAVGDDLKLTYMDLGDDPEAALGTPFNLYADYMAHDLTPTVDREITYQYADGLGITDLVAVGAAGNTYPGMELQIESVVGSTVTMKSDYGDVSIGVRYNSAYTPTMPQVKDDKGVTISTDQLTVSWMLINVANSFVFDFRVSSPYKDDSVQRVHTQTVGSFSLGEVLMRDGAYQVSVLENAEIAQVSIETDSPYQLNIIDIEYRGQFNKRGTRL